MASRHAGFRGIGSENIRFALRALVSQKLRSFLTLLGIVAGVATVIAMVSFVSGFNAAVTDSFSAFGTTLVQFQKYEPRFGGGASGPLPEEQKRRRNLTIEDAEALKRSCPLVAAVTQERYLFGPAATSLTIKTPEGTEANGPTSWAPTPTTHLPTTASYRTGASWWRPTSPTPPAPASWVRRPPTCSSGGRIPSAARCW